MIYLRGLPSSSLRRNPNLLCVLGEKLLLGERGWLPLAAAALLLYCSGVGCLIRVLNRLPMSYKEPLALPFQPYSLGVNATRYHPDPDFLAVDALFTSNDGIRCYCCSCLSWDLSSLLLLIKWYIVYELLLILLSWTASLSLANPTLFNVDPLFVLLKSKRFSLLRS